MKSAPDRRNGMCKGPVSGGYIRGAKEGASAENKSEIKMKSNGGVKALPVILGI